MLVIPGKARRSFLSQNPPTWAEWKKRWHSVGDVQSALGLLHMGLDTVTASKEEQVERLQYYLAIADGHWRDEGSSTSQTRSKAFKILADYFERFLDERHRGLISLPPEGVESVLWFFRTTEEDNGARLRNLEYGEKINRSHVMVKMKAHLVKWCHCVWFQHYKLEDHVGDTNTRAYMDTLGPRIIEILNALDHHQLDKLVEVACVYQPNPGRDGTVEYRVRWELFTKSCRKKLTDLALQKAKSVEEALVAGSPAAKVLTQVNAALHHIVLPTSKTT